jgi:hypothetical protein
MPQDAPSTSADATADPISSLARAVTNATRIADRDGSGEMSPRRYREILRDRAAREEEPIARLAVAARLRGH